MAVSISQNQVSIHRYIHTHITLFNLFRPPFQINFYVIGAHQQSTKTRTKFAHLIYKIRTAQFRMAFPTALHNKNRRIAPILQTPSQGKALAQSRRSEFVTASGDAMKAKTNGHLHFPLLFYLPRLRGVSTYYPPHAIRQ